MRTSWNSMGSLMGWMILALLPTFTAKAEESPGDRVIRTMDEAMTKAKDQYFIFDLIILEPGKPQRQLQFEVTIKGTKWRRVEFLAPGDVKGMRYLSLSPTQMYVYMPAYKKVRRVASHVKDQGFMGSAYDADEMSVVTYGDLMSGELLSENDKEWVVRGSRRPGQEYRYPKLEFVINKQALQPTEIRYYNDKDALLKTEVRSDYDCADGLCNPKLMVMTNHTRNGLISRMVRREWKRNTGVAESFFSLRDLQKRN